MIYNFLNKHPEYLRYATFPMIEKVDEEMFFLTGMKFPPFFYTFYTIQNGILLNSMEIFNIDDVLVNTFDNSHINRPGEPKRICFGRFKDGFFTYNYEEKYCEEYDLHTGAESIYIGILTLFNDFYDRLELDKMIPIKERSKVVEDFKNKVEFTDTTEVGFYREIDLNIDEGEIVQE